MAAQELLESDPTEEGARRALHVSDQALVDGAGDRPDWRTIARRVRGESFELLAQPVEALAAYDLALESKPKVGVKKRATSLRKKLNGGPP
jgi:hypothetical protein